MLLEPMLAADGELLHVRHRGGRDVEH